MTEKLKKGFAVMTPEQKTAIARKGGLAAHAKGTAHEWTPAEARVAGSKGGYMSRGGKGRLPTVTE